MAYFTFNNKQVFYQIDGDHEEVLLILNGIMMSSKSWEVFMPSLCQHFKVLRVDMLDQGQSAKMAEDYTQAIQVELIEALRKHLNIEKFYLAGISYGGSVALQYASKYQQHLKKMVLLNAVAYTSPWLKAIGDGWNEVAKHRDGLAYYHVAIPFIYSPSFYTKNIEWMENRKQQLVPLFSDATFLDAMIRLTKSAETHDVRKDLPNIETQTLIVASEHDYLTPVFEQVAIKNAMPNATLVEFKETGHASMYEKPELFVSTLLGYFLEPQKTYSI